MPWTMLPWWTIAFALILALLPGTPAAITTGSPCTTVLGFCASPGEGLMPGLSPTLGLRGGKSKEKKKRAREEDQPKGNKDDRDGKRIRNGEGDFHNTALFLTANMTVTGNDSDYESTGGSDDSVDPLIYTTPDEAGVGRQAYHPLGTAPPDDSAAPANIGDGDKEEATSSSESYPGCYTDSSEEQESLAEVVEDAGPRPSRSELIRRIRDHPFNESMVCLLSHTQTCACFVKTTACVLMLGFLGLLSCSLDLASAGCFDARAKAIH